MPKTSDTHPLRIDPMPIPYIPGEVGLTFCPGKKGKGLYSGNWDRDLDKDLSEIERWDAKALVSLIEDHEFELLGVADFRERVSRKNLLWFHLPIVDAANPTIALKANGRRSETGFAGFCAAVVKLFSIAAVASDEPVFWLPGF